MGRARIAYQPALDGLRAFAVTAVILYHLSYDWAGGGFLGVDAFFVLSGFLITSLLLTEREGSHRISLSGFWTRRGRRLLPALFLLLPVVVLYGSAHLPTYQLHQLRGDALASLFYVANWHFVVTKQSYFALFIAPSPLQHLWSLAIEEQFYLLWPLVVVGVFAVSRSARRTLLVISVVGIVLSQLSMVLLYDEANPSRAYFGTETRGHTLLVGCLLAIVLLGRPAPGKVGRQVLAVSGLLAFAASLVAFSLGEPSATFFRGGDLAFSVLIAIVIAAVVQPAGLLRRVLSLGVFRYVGRISYGLYLWHWPVIVYVDTDLTGLDGYALNVLRVAITFACTLTSYYFLERPVLRGALRSHAVRLAGLAATAGVLATILVATAGAQPLPPGLSRIIQPVGPCGDARPSEHAAARAELRRLGRTDADTRSDGMRVLVIGDSRACSLLTGLEVVSAAAGASTDNAAVLGCGVVEDAVTRSNILVPRKFTESCHDLTRSLQLTAIDRHPPDVIVWWSGWEIVNQDVNGHEVQFGTATSDALLLRRMEIVYRRLHRPGRSIAILTDPPELPSPRWPARAPVADAKHAHLNDLYRTFAARHPDGVTIVDFARRICPGDPPCPEVVDGFRPRGMDGEHLSPEGAAWAARWLWPQLTELARPQPPNAPRVAP